jgi:FAD:protein FMN transferase
VSGGPVFDRFRALGCLAVVGVTEAEALPVVLDLVRAEVAGCDLSCSRFRDDSELSRLNDPARKRSGVIVSEWFADALAVAIWAAQETGGLVDPTIGQCLVDLGYDRSIELVPPDQPLVVRASHVPAWERLNVGERWAEVPVGVRLDLGATAKALCADRAVQRATAVAGCGALVSLGGDVAVAGPAPDSGWAIRVTDRADTRPADPGPGQSVAIGTGGLATSGTTARRWVQEGRVLHHLVDPRTARPATEVWRTVTVAASSCVEANVASTAAVILGVDAPVWLSGRGLHARLVDAEGRVVTVGGWPSGEAERLSTSGVMRSDAGDVGAGAVGAVAA